jgi:hypothetical protein
VMPQGYKTSIAAWYDQQAVARLPGGAACK